MDSLRLRLPRVWLVGMSRAFSNCENVCLENIHWWVPSRSRPRPDTPAFFALVESDLRSDLIAVLNRTAMDGLNTKIYLVSQMSMDRSRTLFSSMKRQGNGLLGHFSSNPVVFGGGNKKFCP